MVDGVGRELTYVGPQEEEDDDDNDEEEDNDNGGNNNDDELDMMEQGIPIDAPIQPQPKKRNFYSRAHDDIVAGNIMYYHIDLEHTGTHVCQLSVVSMNDKFEPMTEWSRYIKPPPDAEWLEHACNSHKLKPTDTRISNAKTIEQEWPFFKQEIEQYLTGGKVGMLIAWGGKGADCGKLFEITEVLHRGVLEMPQGLKYFADPIRAIKDYKTNKLNESKRQQDVPLGYGIGTVYTIMFNEMFTNHHDSLCDARAQSKIFIQDIFQETFDRWRVVDLLDDVWTGKHKREAEYKQEPTRAVPFGYIDSCEETYTPPRSMSYTGPAGGGEVGPTSAVTRACANRDLYELWNFFITDDMLEDIARETNRYGNGEWVRKVSDREWREHHSSNDRVGSSRQTSSVQFDFSAMEEGALFDESHDLNDLYDESNDESFDPNSPDDYSDTGTSPSEDNNSNDDNASNPSASDSEEDPMHVRDCESDEEIGSYGSEDDEDMNINEDEYEKEPTTRERFIPCDKTHPNARHRFKPSKGNSWVDVDIPYLMAFFSVLTAMAAMKIRFWQNPWMESEGINVPFIQNAMSKNRFEQIKRHLHFVDNSKLPSKGHPRWHPLQKVLSIIDKLLKRFRGGYVMGEYMSVDESMIKYKGRQVKFIQYMPNKPIKHGIKVFALCCGETGYLYGAWVYCGKDFDDASPAEIVDRLLMQDPDFLTNSAGRTLYSDNYYTCNELMELLFTKYKMFSVGTVSLTKKKSRTSDDFAFHKLSGPAKKKVEKGWFRWAMMKVPVGRGWFFKQCSTWMDKKQVGIMHNINVGPPGEHKTFRYDSKHQKRMPVNCHPIITDYIKYMRGVDIFDQSLYAYSLALKSIKWYFRIFYYFIDASYVNMRKVTHVVVGQADEQRRATRELGDVDAEPSKKDPWWKYLKSGGHGWFHWMMDMSRRLLEKACEIAEYDGTDETKRPEWMRQQPFVPCNCKKCFHCKNGLTGRYGPPVKEHPRKRTRAGTPSSAPSQSSSSASRSSGSRSSFPTTAQSRGRTFELNQPHVYYPDKAVRIFPNSRDCGVCIAERRIRLPKDVKRTKDNTHLYINTATLGCPHMRCRGNPVCKIHWEGYKHK